MSKSAGFSRAIDIENGIIGSIDPGKRSSEDQDVKPVTDADLGQAPDGDPRSWLVVAGATAIIFSCLGFLNSYGTLQEFYQIHQLSDEEPSKIAWIGSVAIFLQFCSGVVSGPLFDRYGSKVLYIPSFLYVLAMMLVSLCTKFWHFMLVQSVLMGTCMGLVQFPAFAAVLHYFDKKRAAALGISVSGSSLGGVVMPLALSKMLNGTNLGFGWSLRIIGFVILPLMLFGCLVVKERMPPRKTSFWLAAPFKQNNFILLVMAMFFLLFATFTPFFYLPSYAVDRGMDQINAGYLPAIINAASTFSRIGLGILADRLGRVNMLAAGGVATAVLVFVMNSVTTNAAFYVYAVSFGFASGTVISAGTAALSLCAPSPRDVGTYIGMGVAIAGLGSLIGPPVNGVLIDEYQSFFQVSMLSGTVCTVGAIVAIATKFVAPEGFFSRY